MFVKDYRDPLHGFVSVSSLEQQLIDTVYFQRLRNIRQLATTFYVYPSAMHTRFEHSRRSPGDAADLHRRGPRHC
jgi:HD superfamily phosphohydrolase